MNSHSSKSKTIAKNTMLLYFRTLFGLLVSLYTSRVILNSLGVEDYGVFNVVAGVVSMFSLLSNSLSAAISRYLTFELGTGNTEKLRVIFSSSVIIQFTLALIVVLLIEIVGIWFLNNYINIPEGRLGAAHWVLQCSAIMFAVNLISVPYNAAIIAHEKMGFFAYVSILDQIFKLVIAYLLYVSPFDKLKLYAVLLAVVSILIRIIYGTYCKNHFEECNGKVKFDKSIISQIASFAGWNFLGATSTILTIQGVNVLMNIFFSVVVNAARGISLQIEGVIMNFVSNFTTAINPQITKSYALGDKEYMFKLIQRGSKYSFFLVLIFALPISLETETILNVWLGIVPQYTVQFIRLSMLVTLLSVISQTLITAKLATGKIKKAQIVLGGLGVLIFPMVYVAYRLGMPPAMSYIITFVVGIVQLCYRLCFLRTMIQLSVRCFFKSVLLRDFYVLVFSSILPVILHFYLPIEEGLSKLILICSVSLTTTTLSVYFFGCDKNEQRYIINKIPLLKWIVS